MIGEDLVVLILDAILAIVQIEDIEVAIDTAAQGVVAGAAVQHVEVPRPFDEVAGRLRVGDRPGHVDPVPDHAVGESDLGDTGLQGDVAADRHHVAPFELLRDAQLVAGRVHRQDEIDTLPPRRHLGRLDIGEAHQIGVIRAELGLHIVDHILAEVLADDVDVAAPAAAEGLVPGREVEDVVAAGPLDGDAVGVVVEDVLRGHAELFGGLDHAHRDAGALMSRHHVGEDQALAHGAAAVALEVGVDHAEDLAPVPQVVLRPLRIARCRGEDGLVERDQLAAGGRLEDVGLGVVHHALEEGGEPGLGGEAHGHRFTPELIALQHVLQKAGLLRHVLRID